MSQVIMDAIMKFYSDEFGRIRPNKMNIYFSMSTCVCTLGITSTSEYAQCRQNHLSIETNLIFRTTTVDLCRLTWFFHYGERYKSITLVSRTDY